MITDPKDRRWEAPNIRHLAENDTIRIKILVMPVSDHEAEVAALKSEFGEMINRQEKDLQRTRGLFADRCETIAELKSTVEDLERGYSLARQDVFDKEAEVTSLAGTNAFQNGQIRNLREFVATQKRVIEKQNTFIHRMKNYIDVCRRFPKYPERYVVEEFEAEIEALEVPPVDPDKPWSEKSPEETQRDCELIVGMHQGACVVPDEVAASIREQAKELSTRVKFKTILEKLDGVRARNSDEADKETEDK